MKSGPAGCAIALILTAAVSACGSPNAETAVPDVIGVPAIEARETLQDAGFEVETSAAPGELMTPTPQPCIGTEVTEQDPGGGEMAEEGSTVSLQADCF